MVTTIDRTASRPTGRIPALDFTKGTLVLFMVFYHWLNYFVSPEGQVYRYLSFLTPSFIFITGFLISNVYLARYDIADRRVPARLVQRGLKLFVVFVCLNLGISLLLTDSYNRQMLFGDLSLKTLTAIYVTGNVWVVQNGKAAAFYILVPISYLLLLSALLVRLSTFYRYTFHVVCALFLLTIVILVLNGLKSPNLELLTIGLLGVVSGFVSIERINDWLKRPFALVLAYLCYVGVITLWNVTYQLQQLVGVYLSLMLIYLLGASGAQIGRLRSHVILLGKYSLFGYIATIAILQLLHRSWRHSTGGAVALGLTFVAAFALTMASVEVVDRMRARTATVDRLYRAVFA
jgi:peptidoglycan/LPS O-acetylase OafA/YrhL